MASISWLLLAEQNITDIVFVFSLIDWKRKQSRWITTPQQPYDQDVKGSKVKYFEAKRWLDFLPPDKLSVCQKAKVRKEKAAGFQAVNKDKY